MAVLTGEGTLAAGGRGPRYIPILKGRMGEMKALAEMQPAETVVATPLVEVVGLELDEDDEGNPIDPVADSIDQVLNTFASRLASRWENKGSIIIDAAGLPGARDNPYYTPMAELIDKLTLRGQQLIRPTVRPSDRDDFLHAVGEAMTSHQVSDVCLRLADEDLDDTEEPISTGIDRVLQIIGVEPERVDLLLDFAAIPDERTATFASRIARLVLTGLPHEDRWRTVAVAGGAFPSDLNSVQPGVPGEIPRHDIDLYRMVQDRSPLSRRLDFGDYAIANPAQVASVGFAPAPQIRYTAEKSWIVIKGLRRDRRGSAQFFDICAQLSGVTTVDPTLSWGDSYISRAADNAGAEATAATITSGNAMTWRAIGTSHHIARVVSGLASRGAP